MKGRFAFAAAVVLLCLGSLAQADVFNLGTGFTNLETVTVGDPGNAGELSGRPDSEYYGPQRMCGSVGYSYGIGKYEVTIAQYCDFLNHKAKSDAYGLYNSNMGSIRWGCNIQRSGASGNYTYSVVAQYANMPIHYVTFWDACRFANWLNNGQGDGDTETGSYSLNPEDIINNAVVRNVGAKWAVTSEDEWFKAAYYKGGGTDAGYWDFPTRNDFPNYPGTDRSDRSGNNANTWPTDANGSFSPFTEVGTFLNSPSPYGTFDQGGNVSEWTETIMWGTRRNVRGGSSYYEDDAGIYSMNRFSYDAGAIPPPDYYDIIGFRLTHIETGWQAVPEPSSTLALLTGMAGIGGFAIRKRK